MKKFDIEYENRQIIPRWLPYHKSQIVIHSEGIKNEDLSVEEILNHEKLLNDWKNNKSISYAIQLIASSKILGLIDSPEYKEATLFVEKIKLSLNTNDLLLDFLDITELDTCKNNISVKNIYQLISDTKLRLIDNSRDAILWTDLAYYYTLVGNVKKSEKYLKVALNLNNYNAHVVRSAARFYIRQDNPDKALSIIRKSPKLLYNPMILSSEIAVCEAFNLKSRHIKKGIYLLSEQNFPQEMLSELNGTIATVEHNHGNVKYSKRYASDALIKPNENSLAQIQFLYEKRHVDFSPQNYNVPCRYEADTWNFYQNYQYKEAITESAKWYEFHPLSVRPVVLNSFLRATYFDDDDGAISIIDTALKSNSYDAALLNNKAFSLARLGKLSKALECIKIIEKNEGSVASNSSLSVAKATLGLIEYKLGNPINGRKLYQDAVDYFKRSGNVINEARALYFWSKEEEQYNIDEASKIRRKASELADANDLQEIKMLLEK